MIRWLIVDDTPQEAQWQMGRSMKKTVGPHPRNEDAMMVRESSEAGYGVRFVGLIAIYLFWASVSAAQNKATRLMGAAGVDILEHAQSIKVASLMKSGPGRVVDISAQDRYVVQTEAKLGSGAMRQMVALFLGDKMYSPYWSLCGGFLTYLIEVESPEGALRIFFSDDLCDGGVIFLRAGGKPETFIDAELTPSGRKAAARIARKALQHRGSK